MFPPFFVAHVIDFGMNEHHATNYFFSAFKTDEKLQLEEAGGLKAIFCALEIEKASFLVNCDTNTKFPVVSLNKVFCLNTDN